MSDSHNVLLPGPDLPAYVEPVSLALAGHAAGKDDEGGRCELSVRSRMESPVSSSRKSAANLDVPKWVKFEHKTDHPDSSSAARSPALLSTTPDSKIRSYDMEQFVLQPVLESARTAPAYAADPAPLATEWPSVGSDPDLHESGTCKPCSFHFSIVKRCMYGTDCKKCHFVHDRKGRHRPSKNRREASRRAVDSLGGVADAAAVQRYLLEKAAQGADVLPQQAATLPNQYVLRLLKAKINRGLGFPDASWRCLVGGGGQARRSDSLDTESSFSEYMKADGCLNPCGAIPQTP